MGSPSSLLPSSSMHNQKMLHSLLSIQSAAKIMKSLTQSRVSEETTQVTPFAFPNISIPALDLPFSADVDTALRTLGLKEGAYLEARLKIQEWFHNLQHTHSLNFQRVCHNLASLPHFQSPSSLASAIEDVRVIFQNTYASHLPFITTHILSARSRQNPVCKNAKTPFNNEYTPLLELYFEQNAYPSLPDRKLLARKSMMSMRQIEVWFQNHRARARKEGKLVKKLNGLCQPQSNLKSLNECIPFISAMDCAMKPSIDIESRDDASEDETSTSPSPFAPCLFSQVAPPHAFPTTYPPTLLTDPFPNVNGKFIFPPPIWMRTSAQIRVQTAVPDMDEFISMFSSKLHLRAGSRKKCDSQYSQSAKGSRKPSLAPMVVVPAQAPHPALIRAPYMRSSSKPITPSFTHLALGSYPPTNSSIPSPVSPSPNPHKPRKFAPFSKRAPSALSTNHTSDRPDAFSAFASRTCSFSSAASSQSWSSSSSSESSAEPATPPLSPHQQEQNPLFADHDYQLLDELFGPEPSQLFNNMAYDTPDFLFPTIFQKDVPHNTLYDLSSMFPPAVAQVHC